ncbi:MAG: hypothetical protein PUD02_00695 [Eggerthellales bacterium]|nr:hypothetical protein [Eggerthellales bacterium]
MARDLQELIRDRREMLDVLERNNSAQGTLRLLTDLYPDSAHFVYELLQNAEDAGATEVRFDLRKDGVLFAHNGKREFTLDDVDAITAIGGNVGKKEDSTSIGEFGVGFKAVFTYTLSPEIHSGDYHFRIANHFLIETDGVPQDFLAHKKSDHWTEFDLPFNNLDKTAKKAYEETLRGLKRLDETTLLFLRNISSIEYCVEGDSKTAGYVRRIDESGGEVELESKKPGEGARTSRYLRYVEETTIKTERGKTKNLPIAVAYCLGSDKDGKDAVKPVDGRTFIYFPADKEYSRLQFHINAPFSATVARDSIRECDDNIELMRRVASLVAKSLADIKNRGLLTGEFYAVMPNRSDELGENYLPILDSVCEAFASNDYLLARSGGYISSKDAVRGAAVYSNFLSEELLGDFAGINGKWIANPPLKNVNRREYDFLDTLGIDEFDSYQFARAFNKAQARSALLDHVAKRDVIWIKLMYQGMLTAYNDFRNSEYVFGDAESERRREAFDKYISNLPSVAFLKTMDGSLHSPRETFIMPEGFDADSITDPIVDPRLVDDGAKTQRYDARGFREMLLKIGVREYSLEVELERLIARYSNIKDSEAETVAKNMAYYNDLKTLARAHKKGIDADVASSAIFIGRAPNGKTRFSTIDKLVLGSDYGNELGDQVAAFERRMVVHPVYQKIYKKADDLDCFVDYLRWAGVKTGLEIVPCRPQDNPRYAWMASRGGTLTSKGVQYDFTIPGLPESLEGISYEMSFAIWRLLSENGATDKYALAYYKANARSMPQTADSQLIAFLKEGTWLPDVVGNMHKPGEISFQELDHVFRELGDGQLVAALKLGADVSEKRAAETRLKNEAEKIGQHLISDEDFKFLQKAKEKERKDAEKQAEKEAQKLSARELLDKQDREGRPEKGIGLREDFGSVRNPERRAQKIDETISDLKSMPAKRRARFSVVTAADKKEKETLKEWYRGRCQICDTKIIRHDGEPHFEAINIINTADLPESMKNTAQLGWNSLSLCPNCAAKYRYCGKKLAGFAEQVEQIEVVPGDTESIPLDIELEGRTTTIRFNAKHFIALRQGLRHLDENASQ